MWIGFAIYLLYALFRANPVVGTAQCRLKAPNKSLVNTPVVSPDASDGGSDGAPGPTGTVPVTTPNVSASPTPTPFIYGTDKIRGVNLGGWLVLEPWITPSIFQATNNPNIVDEYTLGQLMDFNAASDMLHKHWDTWITEDDFIAIRAAGLNHVRIPLGYWSVPLTSADTNTSTSTAPYVPDAWTYLLRGLNWAKKHSISVILDIHGAPGSQNGYDNSGQRTPDPQWALNPANITRTIDTLRFIVKNVGGLVDVIELLNEPAGFRGDDWTAAVTQFWLDGYDAVREAVGTGIKVMIGDAFLGVQHWGNFLTYPRGQGVIMDFHEYQIFSDLELNRSFDEHIQFACTYSNSLSTFEHSNIWTIIGEWSTAVTDCAKWLNGLGVGPRWDNTWFPGPTTQFHGSCNNYTGNYSGFSDSYKTFLRKRALQTFLFRPSSMLTLPCFCLQGTGRFRSRLARMCKDGFTGHGRQRTPMNGATRKVWKGDGYHGTQRIESTQDCARDQDT